MSLWRAEAGRWAVVLAGGQGERMQPLVERWLGSPRPKQYCAFAGGKTMLEHTLERAVDAASAERVVTVIDPAHRPFLPARPDAPVPGRVIEQPLRLDTAPGVYLPLTCVMSRDPGALVAILPSDHFIQPHGAFMSLLGTAFETAETHPDRLVALAAVPDRAETEYGWIMPQEPWSGGALAVSAFCEKPSESAARELFRRGALWNTMIVVARAQTLWNLGWLLQPEMMSVFEPLRDFMGAPEEGEAVAAAYRELAPLNFSRDILEKAPERILALPMSGVVWCDWGRPERIVDSLRQIGKQPAFARAPAHAA